VLVDPARAKALTGRLPGAVLAAPDPLAALQRLATAWRRELGASVIGVTGSTGKTSTKDLLLAVLAPHRRTVASRANFNTEIGLPLEILAAPAGTSILVLEMAMRGPGQIAQLTSIAQPDVGVIVTIGPVHLELLGSVEAIAAAKAELLAGLARGATAVVPAGETLLAPHLRDDLRTLRFGDTGDVRFVREQGREVEIDCAGERVVLDVPFSQAHLRRNLLAAVAAAMALGVHPNGRIELALSPGRGEPLQLDDGVTLIDDSYNANPLSVRAALDHLRDLAGASAQARRRIAVLGDMLELGPDERRFHAEIGEHARRAGVDVLVTVGPLAAEMAGAIDGETHVLDDAAQAAELLPELVRPGDVVLVKGSRGVALELVCRALAPRAPDGYRPAPI
jgi:UDP-N-acetylmuramoyl-tripeptide--D-alanyl-D-alanine ligase